MITILAIALIAVAILYGIGKAIAALAPMGYEDDDGFHYGPDPRSKHE